MAGGRARLSAIVSRLFYFSASISYGLCADYGIPIEIKLWDTGRTPLAHMVDITNGFGLKVLAEHNFLNDNNIAFSPYGLMGILVALYEGVDGESSYQIQRSMLLPWNRNVMRIGFRDIHRTLKTYFVPEEGFLAGLALNNENVTFNDSYKKILRFYGFDLENDQIPTLIPESNDTLNMSTTQQSCNNTSSDPGVESTSIATENITERENLSTMSTKEETTINPNAESVDDIDQTGETFTAATSSSTFSSESTSLLVTETTTFLSTNTDKSISTVTIDPMSSVAEMSTLTTEMSQTIVTDVVSTTRTSDPTSESTSIETTSTSISSTPISEELLNNDNLTTREVTSITITDSTTMLDVAETSTISTMQTTDSQDKGTITEATMETSEASVTPLTDETVQTDSTTASTLETLERRRRSLEQPFTKSPLIDDYLIHRSFDIPSETISSDLNTNKMFLVNGLRNVQYATQDILPCLPRNKTFPWVSYMHYDTVLEHAYLPHLEASALRLPLDSERYYLLVVLPSRGGTVELNRLLARMARESDLSDVYATLRPRRVRAIVPSFTVKGHVTLTTDLQKLGIRDVFEPRQHDFTPMTRQAGVYVRSIEQAVSVAIRKYQPDDQKRNRYVSNRNRVFFSATYPFLYFVMDSSIHVALMAGKMVDPLNTRIL